MQFSNAKNYNLVPLCVFCKQSQFRSLFNNFHFKYEIRYFHGCDYGEYCLLACDDVKSATIVQMFRGNKQPILFRVTRQCIYTRPHDITYHSKVFSCLSALGEVDSLVSRPVTLHTRN